MIERIVLTGGPGVGKTALLDLLTEKGFQTLPDAARMLIEREQEKHSDCLPWKNNQRFLEEVTKLQLELEETSTQGTVFQDCSIIEGYAYAKTQGLYVPKRILEQGRNRYHKVLFLERLPFYSKNSSRREDIDTAQRISEALRKAYSEFGYNTISIPVLPVERRFEYVTNIMDPIIRTLC